jgi:hypothetical protein
MELEWVVSEFRVDHSKFQNQGYFPARHKDIL